MQSAKNEILAGVVVLVAVGLLLAGLMGVGGIRFTRTVPRVLTVRFDDASGLKTHDPVFYAGVEVGQVSKIAFVRVRPSADDTGSQSGNALSPVAQLAMGALLKSLSSPDPKARELACVILGKLGTSAEQAVQALTKVLKDKEPTVRLAAVEALGKIGPAAIGASRELLMVLPEPGPLGDAAMEAFIRIGPTAIPALEEVTKEVEGLACARAASALTTLDLHNQPVLTGDVTRVEVQMEVNSTVNYRHESEAMIDKTLTGITSVVIRPGATEVPLGVTELLKDKHADSLAEMAANVKPLVEEVKGLIGDLRKIVGDEGFKTNIKSAVEKMNQATDDLKTGLATLRDILKDNKDDIHTTITNLKEGTGSADAILKENKDKLAATFDNVKKFTEGLDGTKQKIDSAVTSLDETLKKGGDLIESNSRNVNKAIANLKDTSANLKSTSEEVRRHPWWLLHNPDEKEIESLNLYDAARHFNVAAGSLDEAAAELRELARGSGTGGANADHAKDILLRIDASLKRYQEAEEEFWKRLAKAKAEK